MPIHLSTDEHSRAARLRRLASRRGLVAAKSMRRDPGALDYNRWAISHVPLSQQQRSNPASYTLTFDQLEQFLLDYRPGQALPRGPGPVERESQVRRAAAAYRRTSETAGASA